LPANRKGTNRGELATILSLAIVADAESGRVSASTVRQSKRARELPNKVLAGAFRVLKPGGIFGGSQSLQNWFGRIIHIGDAGQRTNWEMK